MKIGRVIGDSLHRLPGVGSCVEQVQRSLRAHRRDSRDDGPEARYATWVRMVDTPTAADLAALRRRAATLGARRRISLLISLEAADPGLVSRTLTSLRSQVYPAWECVIAGDPTERVLKVLERCRVREPRLTRRHVERGSSTAVALNAALAAATGELVAVIGEADVMPPHALLWIADAFERHPRASIVYADEDRLDAAGRRSDPWFKGDYNREILLAHDALSRPTVYDRRLVCDLGGWREAHAGAEQYDLALRATTAVGARAIVHVPRILCHRGPVAAAAGIDPRQAAAASRRAVADLLASQGSMAVVEPVPEAPEFNRVRHPLPADPPLVSVLLCTRDHERLLRVAVDSLVSRTTYPRYEIVVVDNGSVDPGAVAHLTELATRPGIRVIRDDSPFNYSRLNNRAAAAARGELLCLLNDDTEVLTPGWLEEMVSLALQPDVGAVGARLWYPDDTLQHGGVIVGISHGATHAHPRLGRGEPGYFGRAVIQQELSAVTAACLVVRTEVFWSVSGLDERLEVAFNDVDFCLRLRQAGYRNLWTPFAELVHHESASRGAEDTPAKQLRAQREIGLLRDRWGDALRRDPFYNPNLAQTGAADFRIDEPAARARAA